MTFLELARTRQSDRAFTAQAVSREDLLTCVQAAQLAPSACNSQPWKFVIIDDDALVKQVGTMIANNPLGINKFAETAPVLVAVVEEPAVQVSQEEIAAEMERVQELLAVAVEELTPAQKMARNIYYRRLSSTERRKLKRAQRNQKKK